MLVENYQLFYTHVYLTSPPRGLPLEMRDVALAQKSEGCGYLLGKK